MKKSLVPAADTEPVSSVVAMSSPTALVEPDQPDQLTAARSEVKLGEWRLKERMTGRESD